MEEITHNNLMLVTVVVCSAYLHSVQFASSVTSKHDLAVTLLMLENSLSQ